MALDKFFCKVPETKVTDKQIEFHSEREANEYCRDNDIDPHNVILIGDKYIIKTKDSDFRTTMDEAISACDMKANDAISSETQKAGSKAYAAMDQAIYAFANAAEVARQNGDMEVHKRMKLILEKLKNVRGQL